MDKYTIICPKCKSTEVAHINAESNSFACLSCGFQGLLFPEIPSKKASKLPKKDINFSPHHIALISQMHPNEKVINGLTLRRKILLSIIVVLIIVLITMRLAM
jgi:hypothetical protein